MVLNGTSGNVFAIEANLRDFCSDICSDKLCTVFAVFDMCKDQKTRYEQLTLTQDKELKGVAKKAEGDNRGEGDVAEQM